MDWISLKLFSLVQWQQKHSFAELNCVTKSKESKLLIFFSWNAKFTKLGSWSSWRCSYWSNEPKPWTSADEFVTVWGKPDWARGCGSEPASMLLACLSKEGSVSVNFSKTDRHRKNSSPQTCRFIEHSAGFGCSSKFAVNGDKQASPFTPRSALSDELFLCTTHPMLHPRIFLCFVGWEWHAGLKGQFNFLPKLKHFLFTWRLFRRFLTTTTIVQLFVSSPNT